MAVSIHSFLHHNRTGAWLGFGSPERIIRAGAPNINYAFRNNNLLNFHLFGTIIKIFLRAEDKFFT